MSFIVSNLNIESESEDEDSKGQEVSATGANNVDETKKSVPVLLFQDNDAMEEDEDEDMVIQQPIIPPAIPEPAVNYHVASQEYLDTVESLKQNPYDRRLWEIYLYEIKSDNYDGKTSTIVDVFKHFFQHFPRSYHIYVDYLIKLAENNSFSSVIDEVFPKVVVKSRNVDLWLVYLGYIKGVKYNTSIISSTAIKSVDEYLNDRRNVEALYEQAIDSIGLSFNSYPLWKDYLDYAKSWPETGIYADFGKKINLLRKIYQRVLSSPVDNLDILWREYEALEKSAGEHLAEKVLPEFNEKYLHAKTIYHERRRFASHIDFYRLATPPAKELEEIQQLENWNKWIKFESTNPDNLAPPALKSYLRMIYDQFLNAFTHHPEVWINVARLELDHGGISDARAIFREAIETIPKSALLRISFAEFEESQENFDIAKEILRASFAAIPSGFTFSIYQRYVRRRDGILPARKIFSDTLPLRQDPVLAFELSLAHAQLELDVNADPATAARVLQLAHSTRPEGLPELRYIHLQIRTLLRLGDLKQVQWILNSAISDSARLIATYYRASSEGAGDATLDSSNKLPPNFNILTALREHLFLWEELLHVEIVFGLSDTSHMISLRQSRDKAKTEYEEFFLLQSKKSITAEEFNEKTRGTGIFQLTHELSERYDLVGSALPAQDGMLRDRSKGRKLLDLLIRQDFERQLAKKDVFNKGSRQAAAEPSENQSSMIPPVLREFLVNLPSHSGALPDIEMCLRQLRTIILPPRPFADDGSGDFTLKRAREEGAGPASDWLASSSGLEGDALDEFTGRPDVESLRSDDIFRQRQRARLLL